MNILTCVCFVVAKFVPSPHLLKLYVIYIFVVTMVLILPVFMCTCFVVVVVIVVARTSWSSCMSSTLFVGFHFTCLQVNML